jgi:hypothetical protein
VDAVAVVASADFDAIGQFALLLHVVEPADGPVAAVSQLLLAELAAAALAVEPAVAARLLAAGVAEPLAEPAAAVDEVPLVVEPALAAV